MGNGKLSRGWRIGRTLGYFVLLFAVVLPGVDFFLLLLYDRLGGGAHTVAIGALSLWAGFFVLIVIFRRLAAFSPLFLLTRGWKIARLSVKGCIAEPPPEIRRSDLYLAVLAPGAFQAALGLLLLLIGAFFGASAAGYALRFAGCSGLLGGWMYLFPTERRGNGNDGYFLWRLRRFPQTERVLTLIFRIKAANARANTYDAFPDSLKEELARYECADYSYQNELIPLYVHGHILFAQEDREGAKAVYRKITESPAPEEFRGRAYGELFYFALLEKAPAEELKILYQRAINPEAPDNTSRHRVMIAYLLLYQKDAPKAEEEYHILLHMAKREPIKAQAALDLREAERICALAKETEAVGRE